MVSLRDNSPVLLLDFKMIISPKPIYLPTEIPNIHNLITTMMFWRFELVSDIMVQFG